VDEEKKTKKLGQKRSILSMFPLLHKNHCKSHSTKTFSQYGIRPISGNKEKLNILLFNLQKTHRHLTYPVVAVRVVVARTRAVAQKNPCCPSAEIKTNSTGTANQIRMQRRAGRIPDLEKNDRNNLANLVAIIIVTHYRYL
jgi:hypothetical protein